MTTALFEYTKQSFYRETVTPEIAARMLAENRTPFDVNHDELRRHIETMRHGEHAFDGIPIRRATDLSIIDGHERLLAVLCTRTSQTMLIVDGINLDGEQPAATVSPIDEHTSEVSYHERIEDELVSRGYSSSDKIAACLRINYYWDQGRRDCSRRRGDTRTLIEYLNDHDEIVDIAVEAKRIGDSTKITAASIMLCMRLFREIDVINAGEFFILLEQRRHPLMHNLHDLAEREAKARHGNRASRETIAWHAGLLVEAWNQLRADKPFEELTHQFRASVPEPR